MEALFELALTFVGRVAVRCASLGFWAVEPWTRSESTSLAPAGALSYVAEGKLVVTVAGQQVAGLMCVALVVLAGMLYAQSA